MARLYDLLRPYDIQEMFQEHEFMESFQTVATENGKYEDAHGQVINPSWARKNAAKNTTITGEESSDDDESPQKILKHHCPARLVKVFLRQMLGSFVHLLSELHLEPEDTNKPIARLVSGEFVDRASGLKPQTDIKYIN